LLVCQELVKEYSLALSAEGLLKMQNDMGRGLASIAHDLGYDREYILENSWYLIGSSLFSETNSISKFALRAIQIELELTKKYTKRNGILLLCLTSLRKKYPVTLISDFEGSAQFLSEVLTHHGIKDNFEILVSSQVLCTKSTGRLYEIYLDQFRKEFGKKYIHFGDNLNSDYRQPKQLSIRSYWIPRSRISPRVGIKLAHKVLSIRLRKFSYKSDIKIASVLFSNFINELTDKAQQSKRIYYIGSEGAFLSKFAWNKFPNEQICLNFGRKNVLEALASTKIQYVLSKMILEDCNIQQLSSFFQLNDKETSEKLFRSIIYSPQEINFHYIQESIKESSTRSISFLEKLNLQAGDLFIDIGYKGTFIRALTLYSNIDFNYLQLLGNRTDCLDFSHRWKSIYQSDDRGVCSFFRINSKMVEILFSDGPRSPSKNEIVQNFINELNFSKPGVVRPMTLHKFLNSPSTKLSTGIDSISHEDDLKFPLR